MYAQSDAGSRFAKVVKGASVARVAAPFGGVKESGIGREGAHEGLMEYLETKLVGISI